MIALGSIFSEAIMENSLLRATAPAQLQRRQPTDFIGNKGIRASVERQLWLRRAPRTIARSLGLTERAVWSVLHDAMGGDL